MLSSFFSESIVKRAVEKKLVKIELVNLRDFAQDSYGTVDDRPYGGGAGMVMKVDILDKAVQNVSIGRGNKKVILTSPRGTFFTQSKAKEFSKLDQLVIICGHYEGVDERVLNYINEEISMGDFVMTGGEIVAASITDAVVRLLPGVLKKDDATVHESFFTIAVDRLIDAVGKDEILKKLKEKGVKEVKLLEYPQYTRPEEYKGKKVPGVLLSGDPKKIEDWQIKEAYNITKDRRRDLLEIN